MVTTMFQSWRNAERARLRRALNHPATSAWENLGLWSYDGESYVDAARALAMHVGRVAKLSAGDAILDIGPGRQDDQRRLWRSEFDVEDSYSWERDTLPPPDSPWQHVLAVDSAYFVPEFWPRLERLWPRITPGGTLTWTDLYLTQPVANARTRWRLKVTSQLAGIPWEHWQTRDAWMSRLAGLPDGDALFDDLTDAVLGGFVRYIERRGAAPRDLRMAVGTAALLRPLLARRAIGYGLFQIRRR